MGMVQTENTSPSYALSTGEQDHERLVILNELHNTKSLDSLEIAPGMRVLTIGCGIGLLEVEIAKKARPEGLVIATDLNPDQLLIAEQYRKKEGLDQLTFVQMDVLEVEKIPGQFDRVHCRLVLSHLPLEKIYQTLSLLYSKVAPGGFLLLEEISRIDSLYCEPAHPGYDKWKAAVYKQFLLQKSDIAPSKKIHEHLIEKGYTTSHSFHQPVLSTPREKSILSLGVHSCAQKLLQEKLMLPGEIEELLALLYRLEQDSHYFPRYNEISQIKVQKL